MTLDIGGTIFLSCTLLKNQQNLNPKQEEKVQEEYCWTFIEPLWCVLFLTIYSVRGSGKIIGEYLRDLLGDNIKGSLGEMCFKMSQMSKRFVSSK